MARLRFLLAFSFALVVACSPVITPSSITETSTAAPSSTATRTPTVTPTQPPVPTPSPTPLPSILPGDWATNNLTGKVDPTIMYPIVGAIYDADRRTIDLQYSELKLAVILQKGVDLQEADYADDHQALRTDIAEQLDQQEGLKRQLDNIIEQIDPHERNKARVVINGEDLPKDTSTHAQISQVAIRSGGLITKRYVFEDGKLRELSKEEEPLLMPPLSSQGSRFIRTDTGESVMLRGANLIHFFGHPKQYYDRETILNALQALKDMGGNYIVIPWNSGYAEDPSYVRWLIDVLRTAKYKYGFWINLDLATRGLENPDDPLSIAKHIDELDDQIQKDWDTLLSDKDTAFWIGNTVDVFTVISEPVMNAHGKPNPSFFDPILSEICEAIRASLDNSNAICGYSAGRWGWAGDADELLGHKGSEIGDNITINIHPYRSDFISKDTRSDPRDYAVELQNNEFNLSVGEFGWIDWVQNPDLVKELLEFFEENKISYAIWGLVGGYFTDSGNPGDAGILIMDYGGIDLSPVGKYIKKFWSQYQDR